MTNFKILRNSSSLYASEKRIINSATSDILEALTWIYRRIMKISWTHIIKNAELLREINAGRELINEIRTKKLEFFDHISSENVTLLEREGKM